MNGEGQSLSFLNLHNILNSISMPYNRIGHQFALNPDQGVKYYSDMLCTRIEQEIENNLANGLDGQALFAPIISTGSIYLLNTFTSIYWELIKHILEKVKEFEVANGTVKDKSSAYFLQALFSIRYNNPMGALAHWELSSKEYSRVNGLNFDPSAMLASMPTQFRSLFNPLVLSYDGNITIQSIRSRFPNLISDYDSLLGSINDVNKISFVSCSFQNVEVTTWMNTYTNNLATNRLFAQELINSLSILFESHIKAMLNPASGMLGGILINDLPPSISAVVGTPGDSKVTKLFCGLKYHGARKPLVGLFRTYKGGSEGRFNANYPRLVNAIFTGTHTEDSMKAHVLYAAYMIRNGSLHQYNDNLIYYNDHDLFQKTIGLLFAALNIVNRI